MTNGVGDALTFSNRPTSGSTLEAGFDAEAYFAVTGTLAWELYLRNSDGGEWTDKRTYTDVRARQHYHLKFSLGEDMTADGAFVVKVALDNSMDESSHEVTLDFDTRNMPSMSSNPEFPVESGNTISVPVGNTTTKRLEFSTAEGLANLRTYHSNEVMAAAGLPEFVEYVGASDEILNSLSAAGISVIQHGLTKAVAAGAQGATLDMTSFFSKLPVGMYEIGFIVIDAKGHYDTFELAIEIISDVDAEAVSVKSGWACFALFEGRYFTSDAPAGLSFQYKEVSGSQWTEMNPSEMDVDAASLRYTAIVKGLKPSTSYVFRAVSAEDKDTREIPFSTAAAEDVHNLSFDYWYKDGDAWMPNQSSSIYVWDSANPGTAGLGVVPTTPEESDVVKGKAARLQTSTAMSMLAAGNIYIGQFGSVQGLGAELDWGYPFTSRPLALRGYYKYAPKAIDKVKDPYKDLKGQPDQCQIQILLTDWADRFNINTSKKTFVEIDTDPDIIAHGSVTSSNDDSGYVRFTMPIVYRSMRTPKYIVIVAAASRYGDYFTGGVGSVLKIDEFELVYDPAELTDEEYAAVFSNVSPF